MSNNTYRIKIVEQAQAELDNIFRYIAQVLLSPDAADNTINKIIVGIGQLSKMPYSAPPFPGYEEYGIHRLVIDQYNVFYIVDDDKTQVDIIHILHSLQDHAKKL